MKFLVVIAIIVAFAEGQATCDSNLVQALQQCASSISGGETLAMQQQKCTPNGCNYDCPSANTIDTLTQQVQNLTVSLGQLQTSQQSVAQQVASNTASISDNAASISDNANSISDNAASISDNADSIADVAGDVDSISGGYYACGSGGWTRVAYLNMGDPSVDCPAEFMLYSSNGMRTCGRFSTGNPSCNGKTFSVSGQSYTEVCGRVVGYQYGSADAIGSNSNGHNDLNSFYFDGVSITRGNPRTHVWSLMVGLQEQGAGGSECPCNFGSNVQVQDFIGDDYYCESGNDGTGWALTFYTDDQLWDGQKCENLESPCCQNAYLPYFYKALDSATTDDLELRICGDEGTGNEDHPVAFYELFIR